MVNPGSSAFRLMTRDQEATKNEDPPTESDADILSSMEQGDQQAMVQIYQRYSGLVYSVAFRILRDPGTAEDVMQDVLLQIWRDPSRFAAVRGSLPSWLAVITRNRSIDIVRQRRPWQSLDEIQISSTHDLLSHAEQTQLLSRARVLISELPFEQKTALEMAFFDGCTHYEIAKLTNVPVGTIKTRIRGALHTLGKAFQR